MLKSDEKIWRVVVSYENARGGDWYGPLETFADAKARMKDEEKWSRQLEWIEDANGTSVAEHFDRLAPDQQKVVRQAMQNNPALSLVEAFEELIASGL